MFELPATLPRTGIGEEAELDQLLRRGDRQHLGRFFAVRFPLAQKPLLVSRRAELRQQRFLPDLLGALFEDPNQIDSPDDVCRQRPMHRFDDLFNLLGGYDRCQIRFQCNHIEIHLI